MADHIWRHEVAMSEDELATGDDAHFRKHATQRLRAAAEDLLKQMAARRADILEARKKT